jgi:formate hydrogenlyase subunit 3/multisubunit Na+/H+ antiporter MnhD subunit
MPDIALLVPLAFPIVGAAVLLLYSEERRRSAREPLPALIAGAVFVGLVLLTERSWSQPEFLPWPAIAGFQLRPAVLLDQFALPFAFSLALLALAATITGTGLTGRKWSMAFLVFGGSLATVLAANPLMLLLSWLVVDTALVGSSLLTRNLRLLVYRLAAAAVGLAVLLLLLLHGDAPPAANLTLLLADLPPRWVWTFAALAALRMGIYPLHVPAFSWRDAPTAPLVLGRLASAIAGVYLWFRGVSVILAQLPSPQLMVILGGVAALVSALRMWGVRDGRSLFAALVGFELGVVAVALSFATPEIDMVAGLELFNLILAGSVFGLAQLAVRRAPDAWSSGWARVLEVVAAASLIGLPPTPGFVARWGVYRWGLQTGHLASILPILVASALLVPPLLRPPAQHARPALAWPSRRPIAGLTMLGLPLLVVSAQPLFLAPVLDLFVRVDTYMTMIHLTRASGTLVSGLVMGLIVIPAFIGYTLDGVHRRWRQEGRLRGLWQFLSLVWLYDLLASTVLRAAIAVSILLTFLEVGSALGWAVLLSLLLVLVVLRH